MENLAMTQLFQKVGIKKSKGNGRKGDPRVVSSDDDSSSDSSSDDDSSCGSGSTHDRRAAGGGVRGGGKGGANRRPPPPRRPTTSKSKSARGAAQSQSQPHKKNAKHGKRGRGRQRESPPSSSSSKNASATQNANSAGGAAITPVVAAALTRSSGSRSHARSVRLALLEAERLEELRREELRDFLEYETNNGGAPKSYLDYVASKQGGGGTGAPGGAPAFAPNYQLDQVMKQRVEGSYGMRKLEFLRQRRCVDDFLVTVAGDAEIMKHFDSCLKENGKTSWWVDVQDCPSVLLMPSTVRERFLDIVRDRRGQDPAEFIREQGLERRFTEPVSILGGPNPNATTPSGGATPVPPEPEPEPELATVPLSPPPSPPRSPSPPDSPSVYTMVDSPPLTPQRSAKSGKNSPSDTLTSIEEFKRRFLCSC